MIADYFKTRRTIRQYSKRPVDGKMLKSILEAAAQAPNTGNMQLYSVVITRNEEAKKRLTPAHFNQPAATGAAAILTFCVDFNRFEHWCRMSDAEPGYSNFQAFVWGVIDATIFAQQFCTIAEMEGLGCCYLGTTTYNAPQIASTLGLPARVVPVVSIAVGYPENEGKISDRLPIEGIIHDEKYIDYTDDNIRRLYKPKEQLEENRRFVEENGKQTLAQVFTDIRYKREDNEYFSLIYRDFIDKQGLGMPD